MMQEWEVGTRARRPLALIAKHASRAAGPSRLIASWEGSGRRLGIATTIASDEYLSAIGVFHAAMAGRLSLVE
jgi:hypothetical protein